ncbi:MAG TPA: hypothetical protein VLB68_22135 [Pyrinomonadaceae bacterium]|nr:hypothetical protein [Pyrinomonadaceae bacterium]
MNLKTLDTVIALVIVLLILSLVVQSIQSIVKKWLRLKSRSLLNSLEDLFKYIDAEALTNKSASALVTEIKEEFSKLGRVSLFKRPMIDSIAKEDLIKILGKKNLDALSNEVEKWYDTAMQGFEERYTRHMKSIAICISIVVVVFFNANFFQVYRKISNNDVLRNSLIEKQAEVQKQLNSVQPNQPQEATVEQLKLEINELQAAMDQTINLGLEPIKLRDLKDFALGQGDWSGPPGGRWFIQVLQVLSGWAVMVMLLSVGAPFWQDALESLFGVKNLLRKKTDTKNVEDSGGQQKP